MLPKCLLLLHGIMIAGHPKPQCPHPLTLPPPVPACHLRLKKAEEERMLDAKDSELREKKEKKSKDKSKK